MLEEAERAVEEGKSGAHSQLEKAEEELEIAMDAILDAEMGDDEDDAEFGNDCDGQEYEFGGQKKRKSTDSPGASKKMKPIADDG